VCNHYLVFDVRSRPLKAVLTPKVWRVIIYMRNKSFSNIIIWNSQG